MFRKILISLAILFLAGCFSNFLAIVEGHDLAIAPSDITTNPPCPHPVGSSVPIKAVVHNNEGDGAANATFTLSYYFDQKNPSHLIDSFPVNVNANSTVECTTVWNTTGVSAGNHTIIVVITNINPPEPFPSNDEAQINCTIDPVVPIELSSFTVISEGSQNIIKWTTESETDNFGFNIYRSTKKDGKYQKINGKIIPGNGTTSVPHSYSFTDSNIRKGKKYFYYLEDIANDGTTAYKSEKVKARFKK